MAENDNDDENTDDNDGGGEEYGWGSGRKEEENWFKSIFKKFKIMPLKSHAHASLKWHQKQHKFQNLTTQRKNSLLFWMTIANIINNFTDDLMKTPTRSRISSTPSKTSYILLLQIMLIEQ